MSEADLIGQEQERLGGVKFKEKEPHIGKLNSKGSNLGHFYSMSAKLNLQTPSKSQICFSLTSFLLLHKRKVNYAKRKNKTRGTIPKLIIPSQHTH